MMPPNNPNVPYTGPGNNSGIYTIRRAGVINAKVSLAPFQHAPANPNLGFPTIINCSTKSSGLTASNNGFWGITSFYTSISPYNSNSYGARPVQVAYANINSYGLFDYDASLPNPAQYYSVASGSNTAYKSLYQFVTVTPGVLNFSPTYSANNLLLFSTAAVSTQLFQTIIQPFRFTGSFIINPGSVSYGTPNQTGSTCSIIDDSGYIYPVNYTADIISGNRAAFVSNKDTALQRKLLMIQRYGQQVTPVSVNYNGSFDGSHYIGQGCFNPNFGNALYQISASGYFPSSPFVINNILQTSSNVDITGTLMNFRPAQFSNSADNALVSGKQFTIGCMPNGYFLIIADNVITGKSYFLLSPDLSFYFVLNLQGVSSSAQTAVGTAGLAYNGGGCGIDLNGNFWVYGATGYTDFLPRLYSTLGQKSNVYLDLLPNVTAPATLCRDFWPCAQAIFEG